MAFGVVPEIPQEIIDNIVRQLQGDEESLRSCAVVSRSFWLPSRRTLFAAIELDSFEKAERLDELFKSNPHISLYVLKLVIAFGLDHDEMAGESESSHASLWFQTYQVLPDLFRNLPRLQSFSWIVGRGGCMEPLLWERLSPNLRSAFMDLLRSPTLVNITIHKIFGLPTSVFSSFTQVKQLSLVYVYLNDGETRQSPPVACTLPHLEALDLIIPPHQLTQGFELTTPNLRAISYWGSDAHVATLVQQALQTSAERLERALCFWQSEDMLRPHSRGARPISMNLRKAQPPNLQSLSFMLLLRTAQTEELAREFRILDDLGDSTFTKSLKELSIGLSIFLYQHEAFDWTSFCGFDGWKKLDVALKSVSTLGKVHINIDLPPTPEDFPDMQLDLQEEMFECLPSLRKRGILSVTTGNSWEPEYPIGLTFLQ